MMDDETVIPGLVFSLLVVSLIGLNGCDRQDPPSKTVHKLSLFPDTAVGGMARSAKGRRKPELLNVWTLWMSSSLHATIQLVQWRNYICE